MRRRAKNGWLTTAGVLLIGVFFSSQIKEFLQKLPVVGDWFNKSEA